MSSRNRFLDLESLPPLDPASLTKSECFWRDHYEWLAEHGYRLRPRYAPSWVPSWQGTKKKWRDCEDGQGANYASLLDGTRIADGKFVFLKIIRKSVHPYEADIGTFFSSAPLASDPCNHCVPIYDILQVPEDEDKLILVMPFLRDFYDPRFETVGEAVEFFRQLFEGLQFMHKNHVAHRDCMPINIMMDATPLFPSPYHPMDTWRVRDFKGDGLITGRLTHFARTQRPVKYYLVDFGISRRYNPDDGPHLEDPILGGDKTVPEFQRSLDACDPFPTDVYYLGNTIRTIFLEGSEHHSTKLGLEFIEPLVEDMVQDDPAKRPNMDEVVSEFEVIRKGLSTSKLRSRIVDKDESILLAIFRSVSSWTRRIGYIIRRVPPIPTPL